MKVMDVSIEEKNGNEIEIVTPPRKKMKQAQLSFQMASPLSKSDITVTKKRKFESPSPVDFKSAKSNKTPSKSNSAKRVKGSDDVVVIEIDLDESDKNPSDQDSTKPLVTTKHALTKSLSKKILDKDEKENVQEEHSGGRKKKDSSALNVFLQKARNKDQNDAVQSHTASDSENSTNKDTDISTTTNYSADGQESCKESEIVVIDSDKETKKIVSSESVMDEDVAPQTHVTQSTEKSDGTESLKTENVAVKKDPVDQQKEGASSENNDCKHMDSDSDSAVSSSDENADDDLEKSSTEMGEKDKTQSEIDNNKTPKKVKVPGTATKIKKLTPKQIERRLEIAKRQEEQQRLRLEKEKKREEKRKEREMKEMKKQNEIKQKQKEKEAKEEERRKKEEEKLESERKKQKAASNFANFFVAKKPENRPSEEENVVKVQNFMPFEVKVEMRIAPLTRRNLDENAKLTLDQVVSEQTQHQRLYLDLLKNNQTIIGKSGKTWPSEAKDDVVLIEDDDGTSDIVEESTSVVKKHHPKLLMFAENRRPPFWGTWRKQSAHITPRNPFAKDSKWFDYEVDSDEEWEEEEPGESIRGSDDEREEEGADDNEYDVDNDFMVPHGYLSDEEAKADEEDNEDMSPETQKIKLQLLGEQFEAERKTQTSRIQPRVIGCIWQELSNNYPESTPPKLVQMLKARQAWVREIPVVLTRVAVTENVSSSVEKETPNKKKLVPEVAVPDLIRLVHGNNHSKMFLVKEFMAFWNRNNADNQEISKVRTSLKIRDIAKWTACPEEGSMHLKSCWYVPEEIRKEYNCMDVTLPNRWEYNLTPKRRPEFAPEVDKSEKIEKEKKRVPLITQFTKKITQEDKKKQLSVKVPPPLPKPPKRVALISIPRLTLSGNSAGSNAFAKAVPSPTSKDTPDEDSSVQADAQRDSTSKMTEENRAATTEPSSETANLVTSDPSSDNKTEPPADIVEVKSENSDLTTESRTVESQGSNATTTKSISSKVKRRKSETKKKPEPMEFDENCIVLE